MNFDTPSASDPNIDANGGEDPVGPRARGRPVGDHDAKRAELLTAAIAVIAEDGYAEASLRRVAARAGCTTGAVSYYLGNKEAMVRAVAEFLFDEFDKMRSTDGDYEAGMRRYLTWATSADRAPWVAGLQLLFHAQHEPALAEVYQRRYSGYREGVTQALAHSQAMGHIRDDIPADVLTDILSGVADGWRMMLPIEPARFTPQRLDVLIKSAIALLKTPEPRSA